MPKTRIRTRFLMAFVWLIFGSLAAVSNAQKNKEPVHVFIFAGQSNMVGSDSKVVDVDNFPPYVGLGEPQRSVVFSYCIGREEKRNSDGWVQLQPVNGIVGPELSFARKIAQHVKGRIAIIKIAAGGTHLGGDWNPDDPMGFKLYPLALQHVKESLSALENDGHDFQIDGFMWHQGENDMFNDEYMKDYGANLANFISRWREDLKSPELKFFIGELCTKTIWGMDLRPKMYAISLGQKQVANDDPLAYYVPTSHIGVEIGGGVGLHYHYGTLGQLEHGENYADAWLAASVIKVGESRPVLKAWPYKDKSKVKLFVLAGHRNMEGERAFVQELAANRSKKSLLKLNPKIAFRFSIGGGYRTSNDWEPLGSTGLYDNFGPELSFGAALNKSLKKENIAIAKFTHGGSQIIDWTPEGSEAESRNLYQPFIEFVAETVADLEGRGHSVELAGVFYHIGENDMSFGPFRNKSAEGVQALIEQSRIDLRLPALKWFVSQQPPTDHEQVNHIDVVSQFAELANDDPDTFHIKVFDLDGCEKKLVISTPGIVQLGEKLASAFLARD